MAQGLAAFALWMTYGFSMFRRSKAILKWALAIPRKKRIILGPAMLVGGAGFIFGVFLLVQAAGGFPPQGMVAWSWIVISLSGILFVHCQVLAAALLVTLANVRVTKPVHPSSVHPEVPSNDS